MKKISMKKSSRTMQYSNAANTDSNKARGLYNQDAKAKRKKKLAMGGSSLSAGNKVWMAVLAGASAGVIAGLLMAPNRGKDTIESLKRTGLRLGDQLDQQFRLAMNKMESMGLSRPGDSLRIQGSWDSVKGRMKAQYGDLTDQDLAYIEGQEDRFLGNLESKLGKSRQDLIKWINGLV